MESIFLTRKNYLGQNFFKLSMSNNTDSSPASSTPPLTPPPPPLSPSPPYSLPADPTDPTVQSMIKNNIGFTICNLLGKNGIQFDAVDCLRRPRACQHLRARHAVYTDDHSVVITVRDMQWLSRIGDRVTLQDIMEEIYHLCGQMTVEICPGAVDVFFSIGSSIGPNSDPNASGTVGGFVDLINDKGQVVVSRFALTCDHVVRPYAKARTRETNEMACPVETAIDQYLSSSSATTNASKIACLSPSLFSNQQAVTQNKKQMIQLNAEIIAYKHNSDKPDVFPRNELRGLRLRRTRLKKITEKDMASTSSSRRSRGNRKLGMLYAASGYGFSRHDHRLDWALVQVCNRDQTTTTGDSSCYRNEVQNLSYPRTRLLRHIRQARQPQRNALVYKHAAAATGLVTVGVVNPVQSYVATYSSDSTRYVTPEWCIVGEHNKGIAFAGPGDSGALVLLRETADVMGMVFGGHLDGGRGGPVYFTSIIDIATDIERVTGLKVQLPGGDVM